VRLLSRLALVMLLFAAGDALLGAAAASPQLVLTHVSVIDSTANAVRPDQSVVIVNGRIAAIGPSARIKLPKDARIVDGQGKFLIPGLWDMHVHIAGLNADPAWSKQVLLPLLLANGVTGVRDMGGDLDSLLSWKREIENGTLVGPHRSAVARSSSKLFRCRRRRCFLRLRTKPKSKTYRSRGTCHFR